MRKKMSYGVGALAILICGVLVLQQNGCLTADRVEARPVAPGVQVLSATPSGLVQDIGQFYAVTAIFNQPMVPLQALPAGDGSGPMVIRPTVKGKYRWMGTQTLAFIPSDTLPLATRFDVKIPAGIKSVSGETLAREYAWSFTTQRPAFVRSNIYEGSDRITLQPTIFLAFSQELSIASARSKVYLMESETGNRVSTDIQFASADEIKNTLSMYSYSYDEDMAPDLVGRVLRVKLLQSLRQESAYEVVMEAGLQGVEGTLGTEQTKKLSFTTYGPLKVVEFKEPQFTNHPIRVRFTNSLNMEDAKERIRLSPSAALTDFFESWDGDYYLYYNLQPRTNYTLSVEPDLTDIYGNRLGRRESMNFNSVDYEPRVDFNSGTHVIESYLSHHFNVFALNPGMIDVKVAALNQNDLIRIEQSGKTDHLKWSVSGSRIPTIPANIQKVIPINTDDVLGSMKSGAVCVELKHAGWYSSRRAILQITDIGMTAKTSPTKILVWLTSLKDGKPLPGAWVEIRDKNGSTKWQGKANARGVAEAPGWTDLGLTAESEWSAPEVYIFATHGEQRAYLSQEMSLGLYNYSINYSWGRGDADEVSGYAFTNQGMYRPGDDVRVKVIARERRNDAWTIAQGDVIAKVRDADYKEVLTQTLTLNSYGGSDLQFAIDKDAPLGYYRIDFHAGDRVVAGTSFQVQEFRPVEVEVTVKPDQPSYVWGEKVKGTLDGHFLFGMPMSRAPVRWHISQHPSSFTPPGWDDYVFGAGSYDDHSYYDGSNIILSRNDTLDDRGLAPFEWNLESDGTAKRGSVLVIEGTVQDKNRQEISGRSSVLVHPGQFYIGLRPKTTFHTLGEPFNVQVLAVNADGTPLPGKSLKIELIRQEWTSVRQKTASGDFEWISTSFDTTESSFAGETLAQPREVSLQPRKTGYYRIRATGKDGNGNGIATECYFYVTGAGYASWRMSNDDKIELVCDKRAYKPGDVARILVKSPYARAQAMITVEREGILEYRTTEWVGNSSTLEIPIRSTYAPNCFVSVVLLQGRTALPTAGRSDDLGKPAFKMGYIELPVSPDENRLKVQLTMSKTRYAPNEWVDLDIEVTDKSGRGRIAEAVVYVQDIGVLNLSGYATPNPFEHFYSRRALSVKTMESRKFILEQLAEKDLRDKGLSGGGGGEDEMAAIAVRKDFRSCVYWNPGVTTDASGRARVRFQMPENLSGFRVMAVAQTATSQFGSAEKTITVSKDLMLRPALPRFARVGDRLEAGVIVHNYSDNDGTVKIQVDAAGMEVGEDAVKTIALKKGGAEEVRYAFRVRDENVGRFTFKAAMGSLTDGVEVTIPLRMPSILETVAMSGSATESKQEAVRVPKAVASGKGGLDIRTSSTALVDLDASMSYLFEYPYGCLEQKTSRALPMILFGDVVEAFGLPGIKGSEHAIPETIQEYLDEVGDYQTYSGGFSYWKGSPYESAYVSAYAMMALTKARQQGYRVNQSVFDKGINYLKTAVRQTGFDAYGLFYWHTTRAFALSVLADNRYYDASAAELLFQRRDELPLYARAMLLRAIVLGKGNSSMIAELRRDLTNAIKMNPTTAHFEEPADYGMSWCFHSNVRTTAAILETFLAIDGTNVPWAEKVIKYLLQDRKSGRWRTTQENVYAFWAMGSYFRTFEAETPNFQTQVMLDGAQILQAVYQGRTVKAVSVELPLDPMRRDVDIPLMLTKNGPGRLYYTVRMTYSPLQGVSARDEGMSIQKSYENLKGEVVSGFRGGETYRVRLVVKTAQDRQFVALDDPLPAGLEALNTSLATTQTRHETKTYRSWWKGGFHRSEMRDDRVVAFADYLNSGSHSFTYLVRATTLGQFAVPPTKAEAMYEPEVFGRTENRVVEIRP